MSERHRSAVSETHSNSSALGEGAVSQPENRCFDPRLYHLLLVTLGALGSSQCAQISAVLYDLPGRHFYIFSLTIQVQDIFWLAGVLVIFAMLLFFVTGLAGRVWCGYFCFQTLWTRICT